MCYYDYREMRGISKDKLSEEHIHTLFVNGGIDTAIKQLLQSEREAFAVLEFSIGGCISNRAGKVLLLNFCTKLKSSNFIQHLC
jgi:hypothetical protein